MMINKVVFIWENKQKDKFDFGNINKIEIILDCNTDFPVVLVDAGIVKVEDRSIKINNLDVLKKIALLDFEKERKFEFKYEFSNSFWRLIIDDEIYEGVFRIPLYISEIKKIIRYDLIFDQISKKIANYLK